MITTSASEDRLVHVDVSYRVGVNPPLYDADTLGEPKQELKTKMEQHHCHFK